MGIIIYSTKQCPNCKRLKGNLNKNNIEYTELDLDNIEVAASLILRNIWVQSAPLLEINGMIFKYEGE